MTHTELDELEQKYLLWKDTRAAQQILRLINDYRKLEKQLTVKNNLGAPQPYQVCLEVDDWEEQMRTSCLNYPPSISEAQLAQMQEFACQQHLFDIQQREARREKRAARKVERQQDEAFIKAEAQNLELFEGEQ